MRTRIAPMSALLVLPGLLIAQDTPRASSAPTGDIKRVEPPLPPGAIQRLGDTRFRPGARVTHLAFSPDGKRLASWGNWLYFEDRISIWDTSTGTELYTRSMPEGQLADLAWGTNGGLAAITPTNGLRLWSFADAAGKLPKPDAEFAPIVVGGPPIPAVKGPQGGPAYERVVMSPDGTLVAAFLTNGSKVQLFSTKRGEPAEELKPLATSGSMPAGKCAGLRFARDGKLVVVLIDTEKKQSAAIWDVEKNSLSDPVSVPIGVCQGTRQTVDVADDGSALVVGLEDGSVKVFELPSGKERLSVAKHSGRWPEVSAVKFVNGGRQILSAGRENRQVVWDAKTGKDIANLNGHHSWVEAVAVSPDGRRVATAGQDSLVRLWDPSNWKPILPPEGPHESVWRLEASRDGRYAAAGSGSGAYVWELATGREMRMAPTSHKAGYVLFSPDGDLLAGDDKGALRLYPIPAGESKPLAANGRLLDFTPDGKTLLTAEGNTIYLWDWPSCKQRRAVPLSGEILSAAVSPDSKTAVVGLSGRNSTMIELAAGAAGEFPVKLHWFSRAAGFAAGGQVLCGTAGTGMVESWNIATRGRVKQFDKPPRKPPGHFYMLSVAVSPDGRKVASTHSDGGLAVYEIATGQLLADFNGHRDSVIGIAWAGSDRVLSGGGDHQVLVWDVSLAVLAGKSDPIKTTDRVAAWEKLGTQTAKEAAKVMAVLSGDSKSTTSLLAERLIPVAAANPATLDRIFRELDDKAFTVRERASRELSGFGPGAIAGVRERMAKASSEEVRGRAGAFLKKFDAADITPERVRFLRSLEVLAAIGGSTARQLLERLEGGAPEVWETEVARQALRSWPGRTTSK